MYESNDSATESQVEVLEVVPPSPLRMALQRLQQKVFGADRSISALIAMLAIMIGIVTAFSAQYIGESHEMPSTILVNPGEDISRRIFIDDLSELDNEKESIGKLGDDIANGGGAVHAGEIPVSAAYDAMENLDRRQSDAVTNQLSDVSNNVEEFEPEEYATERDPKARTPGGPSSPRDGPDETTRLRPKRGPELRWSIYYSNTQTLQQYARTLDEFRIELGVLRSGSLKVMSQMAGEKPSLRNGSTNESRLFFRWQDEGRKKADKELAKLAGIKDENVIIVHYIPADLEKSFAQLEATAAKAKNITIDKIKRTKFGIQKVGNRREFYVISIET